MSELLNTESAIIGAILFTGDRAMSDLVRVGVTAEWFTAPEREQIFDTAMSLYAAGNPVNIASVADRMPSMDRQVLEGYVAHHTSDAFLPAYIRDLETYHMLRRSQYLHALAAEELGKCTMEMGRDMIAAHAAAVAEVGTATEKPKKLDAIGIEMVDRWEAGNHAEEIAWPIEAINQHVGPISDEYIFLAALESVGKTALACNMALSAARCGKMASIASLESKADKLVQRMIAIIAGVNVLALKRKHATPEQYEAARTAAKLLGTLPIHISDAPMTTDQLTAWGRHEKRLGSKLLIVDNMRHVRPSQRYNSTVDQFRDMSVRLKWLRDDTGLPTVILHHLTDDGDVSWSKDIRRDADILLCMNRNTESSIVPSLANHWTERTIIDLEFRKNREGQRGITIQTEFVGKYQRFEPFTS